MQGTHKSLIQHHSSKASLFQCSAFFMIQLSHPYMTIGKIVALTRQIFVGKVMCLLFNILSRLVIAFLPRSSSVQSVSSVALCDPMDCSSPGFPVLHRLLEFAQTCVHCVGDAVQPSRHLSSPSPPALNLYQHQVFSSESALHISWPILFINLESESMTRDSPDVWYKTS